MMFNSPIVILMNTEPLSPTNETDNTPPRQQAIPAIGRWLGFILLAIGIGAWSWASTHFPEVPLKWFYTALAIAVAGWILGFIYCNNQQRRFLLWTSLVLHLIGVAGQPVLEDDHYRFLWDGFQFATTGTPYGKPPEDYFSDDTLPPKFQQLVGDINYPEIPTVYGATNQYVFLLAYWIKPADITPLQALLAAFNLLLIWCLLKHAPVRAVLLYAWSPLVIKEIALTAHIDGLGAGLLLLAAFGLCGKKQLAGRTGGAVLLALAAGVKVFAWFLIPFLLMGQRLKIWLVFIFSGLALYAPFLWHSGSELTALQIFAESWEFNPSLFALALFWLPPFEARVLLGLLFAGFLLIYWWRYIHQIRSLNQSASVQQPIPRAEWVFGVLLLVSPVFNAWYMLWILPFAVLQRYWWPWVSSIAILLSYLTWLNLENYSKDPFTLPLPVTLLEYSVIAAVLVLDYWRWKNKPISNKTPG